MKNLLSASIIAASCTAFMACATQSTNQPLYPPPFQKQAPKDIWQASSTNTEIKIDGTLEAAWKSAPVKTVWLKQGIDGTPGVPVFMRAMYDGDYIYISAQWPDLNEDSMPKRYVWNEAGQTYEPSSNAEDMFAIAFQLKGELQASMLTTKSYEADVWHWKAGRGNAVGYADDKRNIISDKPIPGVRAHAMDLYDGSQCWIGRPADSGSGAYNKATPPREFVSDFVAAYNQVKPSGSRADVEAKGFHHDGKHWTLEFKRKLNTGTDDDVVFREHRDLPLTIAMWNDSRDMDHEYSEVINLRLKAPHSSSE